MKLACKKKMKVLISGYSFTRNGGVSTFQSSLIFGYLERGWDVHVLATTSTGDMWDEICGACHAHDLTCQPLSIKKVIRVAELINKVAPNLIILNHTPLVHFALPFIQGGIRVAVLHSDDPVFYSAAALHSQYLDAWVAPSPGVKNRFAKWIPKKRHNHILMIPHGVDTTIFFPKNTLHECDTKVSFVGFLDVNKGVDLLPEIFKAVALKNPNVIFNIVGEGPMKIDLMERMVALDIGSKCHWHGVKTQMAVATILRKSAVCVHPTRIEGFGLIITEAMMCGALPVVSRINGVTDFVVEDKVSGFLPCVDDVNAFVKSINVILSDHQLRETMRTASLLRANMFFTKETMLNNYESLLNLKSNKPIYSVSFFRWILETILEIPCYRLRIPKLKLGKQ